MFFKSVFGYYIHKHLYVYVCKQQNVLHCDYKISLGMLKQNKRKQPQHLGRHQPKVKDEMNTNSTTANFSFELG